jgi:hypothetical protein
MENLKSGNLNIKVKADKDFIRIEWIGKSDRRDPSNVLMPYLEGLVQELKGKNVEVIFQNLSYMNSSTVPPIISFMKDLDATVKKAVFVYDKSSNWQAASFKALKTISKNLKNIEVNSI